MRDGFHGSHRIRPENQLSRTALSAGELVEIELYAVLALVATLVS